VATVRFAHPFSAGRFDLAISRFGTMFFADPVAAFTNIGRALRPSRRLDGCHRSGREVRFRRVGMNGMRES
jgi:hypothetical protein